MKNAQCFRPCGLRPAQNGNHRGGLGSPLSLLLDGARWFTWRAAVLYREAFAKIYSELTRNNDNAPIDLTQFWARIEPLIFDPERRVFNQVLSDEIKRCNTIHTAGPQ